MEFLKRASVAIVCFIFFFVACFFGASDTRVQSASAEAQKITKIIIDAGHGGLTNTIN